MNPRHMLEVAVLLSFAFCLTCSFTYIPSCFFGQGVSAGTSKDTKKFRKPYGFQLPKNPQTNQNYRASDIVGLGVDGENNNNFAWYKNGYVSIGNSDNLGSRKKPYRYTLPINPETNQRYRPTDIVAMAVDGFDNYCFAWYKNGYVSAGSSDNLGKYRSPYRFSLGISPKTGNRYTTNDIVGMAIDGNNDHCFVWYKDEYVSAGSSKDLDKYRQPYKMTSKPAPNIQSNDVIDCAIDGENNRNYYWFVGRDAKLCG